MSFSGLVDLETAVFTVRSRQSQQNIKEAISAYQAGAYKSAIMATWVSVVFDLFEKISELAAYDDMVAQRYKEGLDSEIQRNDILSMSRREQNLLRIACDDFLLISKEHAEQFERLKKDRNACAHPSYTSEGHIFQPSAELTRHYIAYSIENLLRIGPLRGKSSLEAICEDIKGNAFPLDATAAGKFLEGKYLKFSRDALLESLLTVIVKGLLKDIEEWQGFRQALSSALIGISKAKSEFYETWMRYKFKSICDSLEDEQILKALSLVTKDQRVWLWLGVHHREQIVDFISRDRIAALDFAEEQTLAGGIARSLNSFSNASFLGKFGLNDIVDLYGLIKIPELKAALLKLFDSLDSPSKSKVLGQIPCVELSEKAAEMYLSARSFRSAENYGEVLLGFSSVLSKKQLVNILREVPNNRQIYQAAGMEAILCNLVESLMKRQDEDFSTDVDWLGFISTLKGLHSSYDTLEGALSFHSLTDVTVVKKPQKPTSS